MFTKFWSSLLISSSLLRSILPFLRVSCRFFLWFGLLFSLWRAQRSFREICTQPETGIQIKHWLPHLTFKNEQNRARHCIDQVGKLQEYLWIINPWMKLLMYTLIKTANDQHTGAEHSLKGILHPKIIITHLQAIQDVDEFLFFIRTDLEKFRITSLAHQWILCSEWVPSEWVSKHLIKTSQ